MAMRKGIQHKLSTGEMEAVMRTEESLGKPGSKRTAIKTSGEDKTAVELFIAGIRGWESEVRRQVEGGYTLHGDD